MKRTIVGVGAALLFLAPGAIRAEEEAPVVQLTVNAPGWVTVRWTHPGEDVDSFLVQRQDPAFTWVFQTPSGLHTDMGLTADTVYRYRVCANYGSTPECSDWAAARTMPPEAPQRVSKAPPTLTRHEFFYEPSRIRIWWRKNGEYDLVLVRWRHKTNARELQADAASPGPEGSYEIPTPLGGAYVVSLKGCTHNIFGAAKCGEWSGPVEVVTAPPPAAPVACIPGALKAGSARFTAGGRAEYHFAPTPNASAGVCITAQRIVVVMYEVAGIWNPTGKPGHWDTSGANTTESYTLTFGEDFSPDRAPRRPLPPGEWRTTATVSFLARARCDRDPWLNPGASCQRTGDNMPQDLRAKLPILLTQAFPHSRNAIDAAERGRLLANYNQLTGQMVGAARAPAGPGALATAFPAIVEPARGSRVVGPVLVKVSPQAADLGSEAEIEFRAPISKKVWRAPIAQLVQGTYVPIAVSGPPADGLQMRIRVVSPGEGPWSPPVAFDLVPGPSRPAQSIQGEAARAIQAAPKTLEPAASAGGARKLSPAGQPR